MKHALIAAAVLAGAALASTADARTIGAWAGVLNENNVAQPAVLSTIPTPCFQEYNGGVLFLQGNGCNFELPLEVDSAGSKTVNVVAVKGYADTLNEYLWTRNSDGSQNSAASGTITNFNVGTTSLSVNVPSGGYMYVQVFDNVSGGTGHSAVYNVNWNQ